MKFKVFFIVLGCVFYFNKSVCESITDHPGHLKRFGSSGPYLKLEELYDLPTKIFFDNYVKTKQAVVMRNMVKDYPAFKLWKDEYLYEKAKNNEDYKIVVETEKKESRDQNTLSLSLTEFLNKYKNEQIYMVNDVPPYLKQDVILPQPLQCGQAPDVLEETVI